MLLALLDALCLKLGYNAALVTIGASLLGMAAGGVGTFLFLRRRALICDAIAHSTLPGVAGAFMLMVAFGGDGRNLFGLLLGAALSAALGLILVNWITNHTRLAQDAAIGAVLSVFFGFGIVLLTIIQNLGAGKPAGLEGILLGSTAGMLYLDAIIIAVGAAIVLVILVLIQRPLTILAFDRSFAKSSGIAVDLYDTMLLVLVMGVTVIGLKLVGLVLIVALLIIPPVSARFWTNRVGPMAIIAAVMGAISGYVGACISAVVPGLPTGPIIVLLCFFQFCVSFLFAPVRGMVAAAWRQRRFQINVHRRQGLLSLAHGEPIFDPLTKRVLRSTKLMRADGVATPLGKARAAKTLRDERRWEIARQMHSDEAISANYDGLTAIEDLLTQDEIHEIDKCIGKPMEAS